VLLLNSIFVAIFLIHYVRELFKQLAPVLAIAATLLALTPGLLMFGHYLPHIVERAVVCGNIEQLQNREFVEKIARVMGTRRSLSVLKLIKLMRIKGQKKAKRGAELKILTIEQKQQIGEAFKLFDKDGNKLISADELADMMTLLGHPTSVKDAEEIIQTGDGSSQNDGFLDQDEFEQFMANRFSDEPETVESLVDGLFAMFDQGPKESGADDAKIDTKEFKALLKKLGSTLREEDVEAVVREIDKDNDGQFDKEEFKHMLVHYAKIAAT
jgi:Ca2+-binding EF-hand superfamily protein